MSFDLYLLKFSHGKPCGLPRQRIESVLAAQKWEQSSEEFYNIRLPDGSVLELMANGGLSGSGELEGCVFSVGGMTQAALGLLLEFTRAAEGVLIPPSGNPRILGAESQRAELPPDFAPPETQIVECHSAEELGQMLVADYQAWSSYRDQVVPPHEDQNPGP